MTNRNADSILFPDGMCVLRCLWSCSTTRRDRSFLARSICITAAVAFGLLSQSGSFAQSTRRPPLLLPSGFQVSLFADDNVAHDVHSLTFNARGQLVVSGPGSVRTLIDLDGDGQVDRFQTFAEGPASGAQGMHFIRVFD